jgi:hypothetical protein
VLALGKQGVAAEEYIRFFGTKWGAIAEQLDLVCLQRVDGEWLRFTMAER